LFGKAVRFDAGESALSFPTHWLDCKVIGADPELHRVLLRAIEHDDTSSSNKRDFRSEVRSLLMGMMGSEGVNLAAVASAFNISSRTLHRRLEGLGTSFQELLDEVRCEMACRLLKNTALPIAQLSLMLGYSEVSAFTRSFKRRLACGPGAWRASGGAMAAEREKTNHHSV
jgi:AraC-like DNA-binding protein